jgi:hypothetical protein
LCSLPTCSGRRPNARPEAIGQLKAGILLGHSFFGLVWPAAQHAVFPIGPVGSRGPRREGEEPNPSQKAVLRVFAEFGVLLLLALTGMEVDIRLLRKIGSSALSVSLAGIAVPFSAGSRLGIAAPPSLIPNSDWRLATALFLGAAFRQVSALVRWAFRSRDRPRGPRKRPSHGAAKDPGACHWRRRRKACGGGRNRTRARRPRRAHDLFLSSKTQNAESRRGAQGDWRDSGAPRPDSTHPQLVVEELARCDPG